MTLPVIAVDGPAASGKGTVASRLGQALQFAVLDTGLLYRAVAVRVLQEGGDPQNADIAAKVAQTLDFDHLNHPQLRSAAAATGASQVAAHPAVRQALLQFQRNFANHPPAVTGGVRGAILDGRDIGTVIVPNAPLKFYVTASVEVRAQRRLLDLQKSDPSIDYAAVLHDLQSRDKRDAERTVAPMKPAADAVHIDSTHMSIEQVMAQVLQHAAPYRVGVLV